MSAIDPYLFRVGIKSRDILAFFIRISGQFRCGIALNTITGFPMNGGRLNTFSPVTSMAARK